MAVTDHYAGTAPTWAAHASRVYGPLAAELLGAAPHPVRGRRVLDAGAGTGLVSDVLRAAGARPVAVDLSFSMLRWRAAGRPPAAVADLSRLPLRAGAVDDAVAAFVLNHLPEPVPALRELARVVRPGGAVLATVYANSSRSAARDRIDEVTLAHGFRWPAWYVEIKQVAAPRLGTVPAMTAAATEAGLTTIEAVEFVAELGLDRAEDLVDYRLGQAHCREWLDGLAPDERAALRADAIAAVEPIMQPYRPRVVRLRAVSAGAINAGAGPSAGEGPPGSA
jgi:SAM-dependent methyltransferase